VNDRKFRGENISKGQFKNEPIAYHCQLCFSGATRLMMIKFECFLVSFFHIIAVQGMLNNINHKRIFDIVEFAACELR